MHQRRVKGYRTKRGQLHQTATTNIGLGEESAPIDLDRQRRKANDRFLEAERTRVFHFTIDVV